VAEPRPQSYANHRMFVPGFHFLTMGLLVALLAWAVWMLVAAPSAEALFRVLFVVAVALLAWYARTFPLKAQDRIIRLETQLRLARLLPPELAARLPELRTGQLIALRFASDEELPDLVRRCLAGELRRREDIKRQIRSWVPDRERL
jgi:hypothetical protein